MRNGKAKFEQGKEVRDNEGVWKWAADGQPAQKENVHLRSKNEREVTEWKSSEVKFDLLYHIIFKAKVSVVS